MDIIKKYKISGAIGLTVLRKNTKQIYIFYDQHNNDKYCQESNSDFIDNILENHFINDDESIIILEELIDYGKDNQIITIWKETKHTIKFKEFFIKYRDKKNIIPFDIRTILFPISPFLIVNLNTKSLLNDFPEINLEKINNTAENMNVELYFYPLLYFFNLIDKNENYDLRFNPIMKHLKKVKKEILSCFESIGQRDKEISEKIYFHFKTIKNNALYFKNEYYDDNKDLTLKQFIKINNNSSKLNNFMYKNIMNNPNLIKDYNWIDIIEILSDSIIEFYAIIIFFCKNKDKNFIHSGLAHSASIVWLLRNHYQFESIVDIGLTESYVSENDNYDLPIVKNCIGL